MLLYQKVSQKPKRFYLQYAKPLLLQRSAGNQNKTQSFSLDTGVGGGTQIICWQVCAAQVLKSRVSGTDFC